MVTYCVAGVHKATSEDNNGVTGEWRGRYSLFLLSLTQISQMQIGEGSGSINGSLRQHQRLHARERAAYAYADV